MENVFGHPPGKNLLVTPPMEKILPTPVAAHPVCR